MQEQRTRAKASWKGAHKEAANPVYSKLSQTFKTEPCFYFGTRVADCRDPKDDKYLELAFAAGAETIVSSDDDLLVLHPWRGVRILRPADYLAVA